MQYCPKQFQSRLSELNIRSSMSEVGQCRDNAPREAIWSSSKRETLICRRIFGNLEVAAREVTHWIDIYNQLRPHSAIEIQIPLEYARSLKSRAECALRAYVPGVLSPDFSLLPHQKVIDQLPCLTSRRAYAQVSRFPSAATTWLHVGRHSICVTAAN